MVPVLVSPRLVLSVPPLRSVRARHGRAEPRDHRVALNLFHLPVEARASRAPLHIEGQAPDRTITCRASCASWPGGLSGLPQLVRSCSHQALKAMSTSAVPAKSAVSIPWKSQKRLAG